MSTGKRAEPRPPCRSDACHNPPVHETPADLRLLQELLDRSYERAGAHLRDVITPDRRVSAARLAEMLAGVQVLVLATVTADGRPLTGPVDGLFYRGEFWFGSGHESVRFRHLRRRPPVSATHTQGEQFAVIVHGWAEEVEVGAPQHEGFRKLCLEVYGESWNEWGAPAAYAVIHADRTFAYGFPSPEPP